MKRILICLLLASVLFSSASRPLSPKLFAEQIIYDDDLSSGWADWSWAAVNFENSSPVYSGTKSIAVDYDAWEGLYLHKAGVDTLGYSHLRFYQHGGSAGGQIVNLYLTLEVNGTDQNGPQISIPQPTANTWQEVLIPLSSLNPNDEQITGMIWQSASGSSQPTVYYDLIEFYRQEDPDTPLILDFSLSPRSFPADGFTQTVLSVTLDDPQGLADIHHVQVDASLIGRGLVNLYDDGLHNDMSSGDGVYGAAISAAGTTPQGEVQLLLEVEDMAGHETIQSLGTITVLSPPGGEIPVVLPQRVGWGSNQWSETPGQDWQVNSGVPWDYVYQYITYGWESWGGSFVSRFVNQAWDKGFIPAVTVYLILGTPPDCGESSVCYAQKLQNASAVNAYITSLHNAALEAAGEKPVIFVMEPDFYGYMQQLSNDPYHRPSGVIPNDPNSYPVALNRSGYANTLAGFGKYLVDMVHQTAPNVLVAPEVSMWATNGSPMNVTASQAVEMAQTTAAFVDQMGGEQSDLLVVEFSDRDAGFYEVVHGINTWWDDTDMDLPRVTRAFLWENALSITSEKRLLLWQVPVGNMSLDNTCDHYRDNRPAYLFNHARDYFDAGVIGVLYGGGAACTTNVNTDGGFVAAQGQIAYAAPPAPKNLALINSNGALVQLSWETVEIPDLWGYRIYPVLNGSPQAGIFVSRANGTTLFFPYQGNWQIRITAVDAMGNESALSNVVSVSILVESKHLFLPLVVR